MSALSHVNAVIEPSPQPLSHPGHLLKGWGTVSTSFAELGKCAARLARLGSSAKDFLDKASIALSSNGDRAAYFIKAASIAGALHTGGACIAAYQVVKGVNELCKISSHLQGIDVTLSRSAALGDSRAFATLVYNMVRNKVGNPTTWVLVYHPDTMWTHHFEDEIRGRGSLGTEFMGIFHDLDTAVVFMMGIRRAQKEDPELCDVVPHFELLMPAYYPIVITTPLCFPDEIQPFTLYCDKYNGESLVWMNLPGVAEGAHGNLGLYKRPKRYWDLGYWFGANESPPRTLGFRGDEEGNSSNEYLSETEKAESEESEAENVEQPDDTATVSAQGFDEFESYVSLDAEDIHAKSGINGVHEEDLGNNVSTTVSYTNCMTSSGRRGSSHRRRHRSSQQNPSSPTASSVFTVTTSSSTTKSGHRRKRTRRKGSKHSSRHT